MARERLRQVFIPQLKTEEEIEATEAMLRARKDEIKNKKDKKNSISLKAFER